MSERRFLPSLTGALPVLVRQLFAKMLMSGQLTTNPVAWKVLLAVPSGVMLWAWVPTSDSAVAKSVCRSRSAIGTVAFHYGKWMSHIGL